MAVPVDPYNTPGWTCQYLITTDGMAAMARAPQVTEPAGVRNSAIGDSRTKAVDEKPKASASTKSAK